MNVDGTGPEGEIPPDGPARSEAAEGPTEIAPHRDGVASSRAAADQPDPDRVRRGERMDDGSIDLTAVRVRRRLQSGFYDRPEIVSVTARRILRSGDLGVIP